MGTGLCEGRMGRGSARDVKWMNEWMESKTEIDLPEYSLEIWDLSRSETKELVTVTKESLWFPWCHLPSSMSKWNEQDGISYWFNISTRFRHTQWWIPWGLFLLCWPAWHPSPYRLISGMVTRCQIAYLKWKSHVTWKRGKQCIMVISRFDEAALLYVSSRLRQGWQEDRYTRPLPKTKAIVPI